MRTLRPNSPSSCKLTVRGPSPCFLSLLSHSHSFSLPTLSTHPKEEQKKEPGTQERLGFRLSTNTDPLLCVCSFSGPQFPQLYTLTIGLE